MFSGVCRHDVEFVAEAGVPLAPSLENPDGPVLQPQLPTADLMHSHPDITQVQ